MDNHNRRFCDSIDVSSDDEQSPDFTRAIAEELGINPWPTSDPVPATVPRCISPTRTDTVRSLEIASKSADIAVRILEATKLLQKAEDDSRCLPLDEKEKSHLQGSIKRYIPGLVDTACSFLSSARNINRVVEKRSRPKPGDTASAAKRCTSNRWNPDLSESVIYRPQCKQQSVPRPSVDRFPG